MTIMSIVDFPTLLILGVGFMTLLILLAIIQSGRK